MFFWRPSRPLWGIVSHSIAVTPDAVNNLSDALSSIIMIVGTKLAGKASGQKSIPSATAVSSTCPSAMIVSGHALRGHHIRGGSRSRRSSTRRRQSKALSPVIIAVAIAVKLIPGKYVEKQGEMVNSGFTGRIRFRRHSLTRSCPPLSPGFRHHFPDALVSRSRHGSAWVIAVFIIRSGIEMVTETPTISWASAPTATSRSGSRLIPSEEPEVRGAYDLFSLRITGRTGTMDRSISSCRHSRPSRRWTGPQQAPGGEGVRPDWRRPDWHRRVLL